ncbi:MAG: glycosyltransferase [Methylotenera sp.]|nr:glycosyltransferase [Methylotenera sp.]
MKLFYFATDTYPPWRVDLTELFSHELKNLGLHTDWSLRRENSGSWCSLSHGGERVYLPLAVSGVPIISPIFRRLGEFIGEIGLTLKLLLGERYDFIQVRDDRYTAAFFAWLAARIRGSKFIYWVSFPFPENDLEKAKLSTGLKKTFFKLRGTLTVWWLYKIVLPRADHVFVQSERMRQDISAYGVATSRMTPVPMGVPPRLLEWGKSIDHAVDLVSVVYLGSFARSRRLEMVIDAFSIVIQTLPNAKLYMVGRGDTPEDGRFLENECRRLGVSDNVVFTGFLPMEQAWAIAAKAAVCISLFYPAPIFMQASPTKLNEYLALGRPVVANEHPEQSEIIASSGAGLCVPWSVEGFADAMIFLLSHPDDAKLMGDKGPSWVAEHRSYDRIAAKVFRQYKVLLDK